MKIQFYMKHQGFARHYFDMIKKLVADGVNLKIIIFNSSSTDVGEGGMYHLMLKELEEKNKNFTYMFIDDPKDFWAPISVYLRSFIDYFRYLSDDYNNKQSITMRDRAEKRYSGYIFNLQKKILPWNFMRKFGNKIAKLVFYWIGFLDKYLPASRKITELIKEDKPDLVMVTPMIWTWCLTPEVVKAAHNLGVKTTLLVASWDNLTNKGLIKVNPDRVIVWNEFQVQEAIDMHFVQKDSVKALGAPTFDSWFGQKPSQEKAEFLQECGLEKHKKYILYLCSSKSIAPKEREFFEDWYEQLLKNMGDQIEEYGVLVRPHPKHEDQWNTFDFNKHDRVAIYPRSRENMELNSSLNSFYDSMFYCEFVVGINTTAMIETGILRKQVFTMVPKNDPYGIHKGTHGTIHFEYLKNVGEGLIDLSEDYADHFNKIKAYLNLPEEELEKKRKKLDQYVSSFIRPRGLEENVSEIYFQEVKSIAKEKIKPHPNYEKSIISYLVRLFCLPLHFSFERKGSELVLTFPFFKPSHLFKNIGEMFKILIKKDKVSRSH